MSNIFVIADLHLGHSGSCKWLNAAGEKIRPFENVEEMDEALINNWNSVVQPNDKCYVLGDVALKKTGLAQIGRCNGKKVLVAGNHDLLGMKEYAKYFYDIRGSHKLDNFILSHIPIHSDSLARWVNGNLHGHLHDGRVMTYGAGDQIEGGVWRQSKMIDPRYYCCSVEHTNYTPILFEDVKALMKKQQEN